MNLESKNNKKVYFVPKQRESLKEMFVLVEDAFEVMKKNLDTPRGQVSIAEAEMAEDKINELRNEMRSRHLKDVEKSKYSVASGMVYNDVFIALEKIGDHIFAVSEGIIGRI
jgi:phosphate:Na+ symporter